MRGKRSFKRQWARPYMKMGLGLGVGCGGLGARKRGERRRGPAWAAGRGELSIRRVMRWATGSDDLLRWARWKLSLPTVRRAKEFQRRKVGRMGLPDGGWRLVVGTCMFWLGTEARHSCTRPFDIRFVFDRVLDIERGWG